jgi:hypothetical protein
MNDNSKNIYHHYPKRKKYFFIFWHVLGRSVWRDLNAMTSVGLVFYITNVNSIDMFLSLWRWICHPKHLKDHRVQTFVKQLDSVKLMATDFGA